MQLNAYFEALVENPSGVRSIPDLVEFNDAHPDLEKPAGFEDQSMSVLRSPKSPDCIADMSNL